MHLLTGGGGGVVFILFVFAVGNLLDADVSKFVFIGEDGVRGFWPIVFLLDHQLRERNVSYVVSASDTTQMIMTRYTFATVNTHFLLLMLSMILLLGVMLLTERHPFPFSLVVVFFLFALLTWMNATTRMLAYFSDGTEVLHTAQLSYYERRLEDTRHFLETFGVYN